MPRYYLLGELLVAIHRRQRRGWSLYSNLGRSLRELADDKEAIARNEEESRPAKAEDAEWRGSTFRPTSLFLSPSREWSRSSQVGPEPALHRTTYSTLSFGYGSHPLRDSKSRTSSATASSTSFFLAMEP